MRTPRARLARGVLTLFLAVGIGIWPAGSASAHDVLISSNPTDGATVATAPSSITFTFDQPVQNFEPVVSLVGPDQRQYASGTPAINGNVVTGTVTAGPEGAYTAAYRVVSADGHPVTGQIHFTVTGGSSAPSSGSDPALSSTAATPTSPAAASGSASPRSGSGGLSRWLWLGLIVAALLIAAAVVILLRRPTGRPSAGLSGRKDY